MKITIVADQWYGSGLIDEAGDQDSCTVPQLIEFLVARQQEATQLGLSNPRLVFRQDYDAGDLCLVGDREETAAERIDREAAENKRERRKLLDRIAERHYPFRGGHGQYGQWRHDVALVIQQRGWDKLSLEELRVLDTTEAG